MCFGVLEFETNANRDNAVSGFDGFVFEIGSVNCHFVEQVGEIVGVAGTEEQSVGQVVAQANGTANAETVVKFVVGKNFANIFFRIAERLGAFLIFVANCVGVFVITAKAETNLRTYFNCQAAKIESEQYGQVDVVSGNGALCRPFHAKFFTLVFFLGTLHGVEQLGSDAHVVVQEIFAHNANIETGFHSGGCGVLHVDVAEVTAGLNAKFELSHQA